MLKRVLHTVLLSYWALGCSRQSATIERVNAPAGVQIHVLQVDMGAASGISGAALDRSGKLWVVAERERKLLAVRNTATTLSVEAPVVHLSGIAEDLETESLAWLDGSTLLLGTETSASRTHDELLLMRVDGARATLTRKLTLDYRALGVVAEDNHGVEGACSVDDQVVLGVELRSDAGTAPVVVYDRKTETWRAHSVRLTSETGKLSSLECRRAADGVSIEVIAIERHYGVARLLAFTLGMSEAKASRVLETRLLLDLAQAVAPLPNFESVVWLDDALLLITDNHHGGVTGPTQALRITGLKLPAVQKR